MMDIFIRLDRKGEWRGTDHRSSIAGLGDEFENLWEDGSPAIRSISTTYPPPWMN